jgi:hypothetical protein
MTDQYQRLTRMSGREDLDQLVAPARVQIVGRLVEQDQVCIGRER